MPIRIRMLAVVSCCCITGWSSAQTGAPVLSLANFSGSGATEEFLSISLADGSGHLVDRLERDPTSLRSRSLAENLFVAIGRSRDQPAGVGEIFFAPILSSGAEVRAALYVETAIGYAAYFENPGRGNKLGEILTLTSRPFESIAASDGNFALLMRRDNSGRTEGAYLYHATTGQAVYLDGLKKLEISASTRSTAPLPTFVGKVSAVEIYAGSEATASYLVFDGASGEIHVFDVAPGAADQIRTHQLDLGLFDIFGRDGTHTSGRRFLALGVQASASVTEHVFLADAVTGDSAVLEFVTDADNAMRLRKAAPVGTRLASEGGQRVFSAVPRVTSSGATIGLWLIDSQTSRTVYVDRPGLPEEMTVTPVSIARR